MATSVLKNALVLAHAVNVTGETNNVGVDYGAETEDNTAFDGTTRSNKGGLKTAGVSAEGFFDPDNDADLFTRVGMNGVYLTVANGNANGDRSFSLQTTVGSYQPVGGSVGELASYSLNASARGDLERGQVLFHSDSETADGTSTPLNAGSAATSLVAYLHVWTADGSSPTLDVTIESDSADDFTGNETTRLTFDQATGRTAQRKTGTATSDTWWRVNYTIGGANADFAFAVILIPTA